MRLHGIDHDTHRTIQEYVPNTPFSIGVGISSPTFLTPDVTNVKQRVHRTSTSIFF